MTNAEKAAHYLDIAQGWADLAAKEDGKTRENGWTSWELYAAERRKDECLKKQAACLARAKELSNEPITSAA